MRLRIAHKGGDIPKSTAKVQKIFLLNKKKSKKSKKNQSYYLITHISPWNNCPLAKKCDFVLRDKRNGTIGNYLAFSAINSLKRHYSSRARHSFSVPPPFIFRSFSVQSPFYSRSIFVLHSFVLRYFSVPQRKQTGNNGKKRRANDSEAMKKQRSSKLAANLQRTSGEFCRQGVL